MSFSSVVKNELCRMEVKDRCCCISELSAVVAINTSTRSGPDDETVFKVVTENAAFARRVFSLIKELFNVNAEVVIRKSKKLKKHTLYSIVVTPFANSDKLINSLNLKNGDSGNPGNRENISAEMNEEQKICCKKSYLRGAFLASGSVSDPEKTYHLELICHNIALARKINGLLADFSLNGKIIRRKNSYVVYLKEGENIVDFLNIIGAHNALLELENIRILKDMRNNVNRLVNCETANLSKTINASVRQVENIKYIRDNLGFSSLPKNLREIAELRLRYTDANLKELGEMLTPTLGKSGVNHRLRRLDKIADDLRNSKGGL